VQRSVFIGRGGYAKAKDVVRAALRLIDRGRDSVAAVVVPEDYAKRILVAGSLMDTPGRTGDVVLVV
jgi:CRISPR-associated protein Cas2